MSGLSRPAAGWLLVVYGALAAAAPPFAAELSDRWELTPTGLAGFVLAAAVVAAALAALLGGARSLMRGDRRSRSRVGLALLAAAALGAALALSVPWVGAAFACTAAALACASLLPGAMVGVDPVPAATTRHWRATALRPAAVAAGAGAGALLLVADAQMSDGTAGVGLLALPAAAAAAAVYAATRDGEAQAKVGSERSSARASPLLSCQGLTVSRGGQRAVDGVDLTIQAGELLALVGTNGAGKTTLLRTICGLTAPMAGRLSFDGRSIFGLPPEQRHRLGIALMAGGDGVFDSLTVSESLSLAARATRRGSARVGETRALIERLPQLNERRDATVRFLSGGERQLLSLAQAVLCNPRLLLLDDLSAGLASDALEEALWLVRELNARGTAVLWVEQSLALALRFAPRVCFMDAGRIRFDGPADGLRQRADLLRAIYVPTTAQSE